jgi:hypothetical protein
MSWNGQSRIDRSKEAATMAKYQVVKSQGKRFRRLDVREESLGVSLALLSKGLVSWSLVDT